MPLPDTFKMEHLASKEGICTASSLGRGCNSVAGCLLNICEALGLNLNTIKKIASTLRHPDSYTKLTPQGSSL